MHVPLLTQGQFRCLKATNPLSVLEKNRFNVPSMVAYEPDTEPIVRKAQTNSKYNTYRNISYLLCPCG